MKVYSKTDIGLVRASNQDACDFQEISDDSVWAVVCDGMGGANGGNIASQLAIEQIRKYICSNYNSEMGFEEIKQFLESAVESANKIIYEKSKKDINLFGMGTTIVLTLIKGGIVHIVNVGDSRAYLVSDININQITTDHSVVQEMVSSGEITKEEAKNHPQKNIITRALGVNKVVKIDYINKVIQKEEMLLLCTDGLTNYITPRQIREMCSKYKKDELVEKMILQAKEMGGEDNITVIIIGQ